MKRALILTILLLTASPVVLVAAGCQVDGQKENIVITESTLYGDPQAAEGLKLKMEAAAPQMEAHMFWDTSYALGSGEAESSFVFSSRAAYHRLAAQPNDYINMSTVPYGGAEGFLTFSLDMIRLSEVVEEMAERTKAGEQHTETMRPADYLEYYPLIFRLQSYVYDVYYDDGLYYEEGSDRHGYFKDFFQIPVSDREVWEVTLEKDEAGEVIDAHYSLLTGLMIDNLTAFGREGAYHVYCLKPVIRTDYREADLEADGWPEIEPGENYGIFYYPYMERPVGDRSGSSKFTIDPEQARKVCGLEPGIQPRDMALNEAENRLYLVTSEEEDIILRVYEVGETGASLRQKLPVCSVTAGFSRLSVQEEGILLVLDGGCFAFVDTRGDELKLWRLEEEPVLSPIYFRYENFWDFDGERLALASFTDDQRIRVNLAVYTEDGMAWCGICEHGGDSYNEIQGVEWEEAI